MNNKYTSPSVLDTNINSLTYEFNAYVSPDENIILFSSYGRADDTGGGDLYISTKNKNGMWQPARNAGPAINSSGLDYCPFIDFPRNKFYFTSNRGSIPEKNLTEVAQFRNEANKTLNGYDNIYQIDLSALKLK